MDSGDHNVTVTILEVSLALVHIPRSRLNELSRPILKQLLRKNPKFLNLTANELELSIFAEDGELDDFDSIARRDRRRLRQSAGTAPSVTSTNGPRKGRASLPEAVAVEVSADRWRVLQIDSHDDSQTQSGSRVRELSAPLAAAGVSIFYQSSHLSDFIFIKEQRLPIAMKLLDEAGFTMYNTDPFGEVMAGVPYSPDAYTDGFGFEDARRMGFSGPGTPAPLSPAILSRTRSPSLASIAGFPQPLTRQATSEDLASSGILIMHRSRLADSSRPSSPSPHTSRTPKKSLSPTAAPVDVLEPDIACVGLSESASDIWTTKILTLVGYPELIPASSDDLSMYEPRVRRRGSLAESLYGSFRDNRLIPDDDKIGFGSAKSNIFNGDGRLETMDDSTLSDCESSREASEASSPPSSPSSESAGEDDYFSSSPIVRDGHRERNRPRLASNSSGQSASATSMSSTRSLPDRLEKSPLGGGEGRAQRRKPPPPLAPPATRERSSTPSPTERERAPLAQELRRPLAPLRVPFFSFTRTAEGSSLTTDLGVLAALFAPEERHMIISSEALLDEGDERNRRAAVEEQMRGHAAEAHDGQIFHLDTEGWGQADGEEDECPPGMLKCLQVDLAKFGLEKHGLVSRFSQVLEEHGINHMYSSTYKTANLLVDKRHAWKAQSLLRSC